MTGKTGRPRSGQGQKRAGAGWRRKADGVLDEIGQQIVSGQLGPGERLPTEAQLAQQLGVSRPSLREALTALARKGLVEPRARRGTLALPKDRWDVLDPDVLRWMVVAPPDPEFLIVLLEARTIFEPAAARLAAQRATPAQIVEIERAYRDMAASLPHDVEACCRHDLALHEGIIAASGNVLLSRLALTIRTALLALFQISANARESYENSLAEHRAVVVAIRRRAAEEAEEAMRRLLAGTARDLAPALEPNPGQTRTKERVQSAASRPARKPRAAGAATR